MENEDQEKSALTPKSPSPEGVAARSDGPNRRILGAGAVIVVLLIVAAVFFALPRPHPVARKTFDPQDPTTDRCLFKRPDVLIHTKALSRLPDDLKRLPLLAELLDAQVWEDVRHGEARLSLQGTLYRIAFEKNLEIEDSLMKFLLDSPVEMAVWGGYKGTVKDAMLVFTSSPGKDFLLKLLDVAKDDTQVTSTNVYSDTGEKISAVAIEYAKGRSLYLAANEGYFYAFTNTDCSLPTTRHSGATARKDWLGYPKDAAVFMSQFPWIDDTHLHEIIFSFSYLSGGYASVISGVDAVRLYTDGDSWGADALTKETVTQSSAVAAPMLWNFLPQDVALCVHLPFNLEAAADLLTALKLVQDDKVAGLHAAALKAGAAEVAACWLKEGSYDAPVFVARNSGVFELPLIRAAFARILGGREGRGTAVQPPFAVEEQTSGAFTVMTRDISAESGMHAAQESSHSSEMRFDTFYRVGLAVSDQVIIFSPEKDGIDKVLAVVNHLAPALSEKLVGDLATSRVVFMPAAFQGLLSQTMTEKISDSYRAAVWARFMPAIDAWLVKPGYGLRWGGVGKDLRDGYVQRDLIGSEIK